MPKYLPKTALLKAKKLSKAIIDAGLNQSEVARREGVTPGAINQRVKKNPAVNETMAQVLDRIGVTDEYLGVKIKEGLESCVLKSKGRGKKKIEILISDPNTRHKYVQTSLEVKKHIKSDVDPNEVVINVHFGHRKKEEVNK